MIPEPVECSLRAPVREPLSNEATKHLRPVGTHLRLQFGKCRLVFLRKTRGNRVRRYDSVRYDTQ